MLKYILSKTNNAFKYLILKLECLFEFLLNDIDSGEYSKKIWYLVSTLTFGFAMAIIGYIIIKPNLVYRLESTYFADLFTYFFIFGITIILEIIFIKSKYKRCLIFIKILILPITFSITFILKNNKLLNNLLHDAPRSSSK